MPCFARAEMSLAGDGERAVPMVHGQIKRLAPKPVFLIFLNDSMRYIEAA